MLPAICLVLMVFDRIETPALEQVDTFVHGIGESTDVVRKEMFRVFFRRAAR